MGFELALSEDKRFVIFKPQEIGSSLDVFVRRRAAIGAFADKHGVNSILMDYRGRKLSLDPGFFEAALTSPRLKLKNHWRVAILVSLDVPQHSIELATGLADILNAMGQDARNFLDLAAAVLWLAKPGD